MVNDRHDISEMPTDEVLTAFIDGQLSEDDEAVLLRQINDNPQISERLEYLYRASLDFASAFQPLLDTAPVAALQAQLDAIPATQDNRPGSAANTINMGRRGFMGLLAASVVAGVFADRVWIQSTHNDDDDAEDGTAWRAVVAQYMALYTAETLGDHVPSLDAQRSQLAMLNQRLGLALTPDTIALPNLEFRHAQILAYDAKPLAQILYMDPQNRPLALCILRSKSSTRMIETETRQSMNIAWWSGHDYQALLIGTGAPTEMHNLAENLRGRLFPDQA